MTYKIYFVQIEKGKPLNFFPEKKNPFSLFAIPQKALRRDQPPTWVENPLTYKM